jgi:hypothetical protein
MDEGREKLRRDLTRLLTAACEALTRCGLTVSAEVAEYIENYEFGLAYEVMIDDLNERHVRPADDAAESLVAAAAIMGLDSPI